MSRSTPASAPSIDGGSVEKTFDATVLAVTLNAPLLPVQSKEKGGQPGVGRGLCPVEHRRLRRHHRIASVVEVSGAVLHVANGPRRHLAPFGERSRMEVREVRERLN